MCSLHPLPHASTHFAHQAAYIWSFLPIPLFYYIWIDYAIVSVYTFVQVIMIKRHSLFSETFHPFEQGSILTQSIESIPILKSYWIFCITSCEVPQLRTQADQFLTKSEQVKEPGSMNTTIYLSWLNLILSLARKFISMIHFCSTGEAACFPNPLVNTVLKKKGNLPTHKIIIKSFNFLKRCILWINSDREEFQRHSSHIYMANLLQQHPQIHGIFLDWKKKKKCPRDGNYMNYGTTHAS